MQRRPSLQERLDRSAGADPAGRDRRREFHHRGRRGGDKGRSAEYGGRRQSGAGAEKFAAPEAGAKTKEALGSGGEAVTVGSP